MDPLFGGYFRGRRVLVTGHTGFKGSWMSRWLLQLGAEVHGIALAPEPHETLYPSLELASQIASDLRVDIRDLASLTRAIHQIQPEVVFHLAAQSLVRVSFERPVETFDTNVMGTINVLEAIRGLQHDCIGIMVTTDKCYENREWVHSYRENDPMGGFDPYSASKGCAELAISAYRRSFFTQHQNKRIASVRAGNVIGGGDWAHDRIVPDVFRALRKSGNIAVRNKHATRPWQHVLEPLSGYLWLAARLASPPLPSQPSIEDLCSGFNFGPNLASNRTVAELVQSMLRFLKGTWSDGSDPNAPHEASKLNLAIDKAFHLLQWSPTWDFDETVAKTVEWYERVETENNAVEMTDAHIQAYVAAAQAAHQAWATL